ATPRHSGAPVASRYPHRYRQSATSSIHGAAPVTRTTTGLRHTNSAARVAATGRARLHLPIQRPGHHGWSRHLTTIPAVPALQTPKHPLTVTPAGSPARQHGHYHHD